MGRVVDVHTENGERQAFDKPQKRATHKPQRGQTKGRID